MRQGVTIPAGVICPCFISGVDPLSDLTDGNSINSVAGVLKSFFRELRDPLFPTHMFDDFINAASKLMIWVFQQEANRKSSLTRFFFFHDLEPGEDKSTQEKLSQLIYSLSAARIVVMRYLFAFLYHLSQYSDENLMQPYNLAVCFGPALLPIPDNKEQVNSRTLKVKVN